MGVSATWVHFDLIPVNAGIQSIFPFPRGRAIVVVVHGSPEATIISDDRDEGKRGGSFTDETIMDGAKTTATTEWGMRQ